MPAPLSNDLRERIVRAYRTGGVTYDELAELFEVGRASVSRYLRIERLNGGSVAPKPATGGSASRFDASSRAALISIVDERPDATVEAIASEWATKHSDLAVSASTIGREIRKAGYTLKKRRSELRNGTAKTSS